MDAKTKPEAPQREAPRMIELPLDAWQALAQSSSVMRLVESKPGMTPSVVRVVAGGRLAIVSGVLWGDLGTSRVYGHLLELESSYQGPTTDVYHDEDAIRAGLMERGCHRGFVVQVAGKRMVCAEAFRARPTAPSTKLDLTEALLKDRELRCYGWRQHRADHPWPNAWFEHEGHPVVEYLIEGRPHRMLMYRFEDGIEERPLPEDWPVQKVSVDEDAVVRSARPAPSGHPFAAQTALF